MFKDDIRPKTYWVICSSLIVVHVAFFIIKNEVTFSSLEKVLVHGYKLSLPFVVLLLVCLVPRQMRDSLAHFKIKNPLPGSEAFSRWAKKDPRVSLDLLKAKYGKLPTKRSRDQNAKWYELYKKIKKEPEIIAVQRKYILFRDLALIQTCAIFTWIALAIFFKPLFGFEWAILLAIYGVFVMATRNTSVRFVQTVLAIAP